MTDKKKNNTENNSTKKSAMTVYTFLLKNRDKMTEEEVHALHVLIAAADQQPDWEPKMWHCDTYCRKIRHVSCEGMLSSEESAGQQCPFLDEMLY